MGDDDALGEFPVLQPRAFPRPGSASTVSPHWAKGRGGWYSSPVSSSGRAKRWGGGNLPKAAAGRVLFSGISTIQEPIAFSGGQMKELSRRDSERWHSSRTLAPALPTATSKKALKGKKKKKKRKKLLKTTMSVADLMKSRWAEWSDQKTLEALQKVPLFRELSDVTLRVLGGKMIRRSFRDGQFIITEGDLGTEFFLLVEGEVRIRVNKRDISKLASGAFFGEQALITKSPRNSDVVAVGECLVLKMNKKDFKQVLKNAAAKKQLEEETKRRSSSESQWARRSIRGRRQSQWTPPEQE